MIDKLIVQIVRRDGERQQHVKVWPIVDGVRVGYLEVRERQHAYGRTSIRRDAEIVELRIDEAHRRQGYARALVEWTRGWARQHGYEALAVESTAREDKPAPGFYRAAGFTARSVIWDLGL